ncbi:beta-hexosaminidase subunit A2-like isoform X2 [Dysidea avara]|uniref:beta-hexosaminidase subunit A2-like isoform X2 n=1 Tax=Dysidea avara TaxID=196820 RepID=UPI00331BC61C
MGQWTRVGCFAVTILILLVLLRYYFFPRLQSSPSSWRFSDKSHVPRPDATLPIWPLPRHTSALPSEDVSMFIGSNVKFKVKTASKILGDAVKRYQSLITTGDYSKCTHKAIELNTINVRVSDDSENLNSDRKYEVIISSETKDITIISASPFGAIYGLETISQIFFNHSCISYSQVYIKDYPMYRHRGLLLDVGRRISPKELVFTLLDTLSYLKMNVFHFHLSDYCRYSMESKVFPQLTAHLKPGQFYTQKDVRDIIEYARQRGIRVIPEIELPGHAKGLSPLAGDHMEFCNDDHRQIYNDPEGKSLKTLKKLIDELVKVFPDRYLHMGSDETYVVDRCTTEGITAMEKEIAEYILSLGRIPIGWEEALFKSNVEVPGMAYQAWRSYSAVDIVGKGYEGIESQYLYFYMDVTRKETRIPWRSIALEDPHNNKYLGGELAMWMDHFCENYQCWNEETPIHFPKAYWMFQQDYDQEFMKAILGMVWPRGIPAAGSFWNYNDALQPDDPLFESLIKHTHQVMLSRGVQACPSGCSCNEVMRCGIEYKRPK